MFIDGLKRWNTVT